MPADESALPSGLPQTATVTLRDLAASLSAVCMTPGALLLTACFSEADLECGWSPPDVVFPR